MKYLSPLDQAILEAAENAPTIKHGGKEYTVEQLADNAYLRRLSEKEHPVHQRTEFC